MIMPPLKVGEAGMVWILLLEGRWKMSTWWELGLRRKASWRTGQGGRREMEKYAQFLSSWCLVLL
jgi:hypothetical protein